MPIFKAGNKLVYYAHVPKCGGSSVNWYLTQRFGQLAFTDSRHTSTPPAARWTRTSPQHVDRESLGRLFPAGFFDVSFSIVRHPVARLLSAYHFQRDVEQSMSSQIVFSEWLADLPERMAEDPFVFDNHVRPMSQIVPADAKVFYVEHGIDHIVPWFDAITGTSAEPRAIPKINELGQYAGSTADKARPSEADLQQIASLYAEDFDRFGYEIGSAAPLAAAPDLSDRQVREMDDARKAMNSTLGKMKRKFAKLGF